MFKKYKWDGEFTDCMNNKKRGFLMIDAMIALLIISTNIIIFEDFSKTINENLNERRKVLIKKRINYEQQKGFYDD